MLMIILVTSLVTILAVIISSALYLISLICSGSDDEDDSNSLAIDARDFTSSPVTVSPTELAIISDPTCENRNHHHLCERGHDEHPVHTNHKETDTLRAEITKENDKDQVKHSSIHVNNHKQQHQHQSSGAQINTWTTTVAVQKAMITNQLGALVSKQLFDDFDPKEMQLGGTGLHWCKSRRSIDRLIKLNVPLDIVNKRQETAIHVAVRRKKLQILIGLLSHGAKVDCRNDQGETPLLLACRLNEVFACQLLLTFDANVDIIDKYGLSPRHYSAAICDKHKVQPPPNQPNASHLILAMLNEMNAKRCPKQLHLHIHPDDISVLNARGIQAPCSDGCSKSGSYNGNSYNRWPNCKKESLYKRHMFSDIIESKLKEKASSNHRKKSSRLLCIDGGGMRGVIICQILIEMEKYLEKPAISYFDWVGGTSVGAFLACALCTGVSLQHLRRISFDVKDEVFSGSKPYQSKFLERVLKRTLGISTRMSDVKNKKLAVTTVIADRDPCQLRFFKNYKSSADLLEHYGFSADTYDFMSSQAIIEPQRQSSSLSSKLSSTPSVKSVTSNKSNTSLSSTGNNLPASLSVSTKQTIQPSNKSSSSSQTTTTTNRSVKQTAVQQQRQPSSIDDDDTTSLNEDTSKDRSKSGKSETQVESIIDETEQDPLLWQAVRASGAAPFFFKPYGPYLDGGIISNNPTVDMMTEFYAYERVKSFLRVRIHEKTNAIGNKAVSSNTSDKWNVHEETPSELNLVLSLGTGRGRVVGQQAMIDFGNVASGLATVFSPVELLRSIRAARELFKKLMHRSCMTDDHVLDRAQSWCSSLKIPYFRLNPPLVTIFSIDDKRDEQLINALWQTKLYMRSVAPQLKQLADLLDK